MRAYASGRHLAGDPEVLRADCLVADLVMPENNGIVLLQDLRAAGWQGGAILISGHLDNEWTLRAREAGFDLVIAKPIPENILVNGVLRLIEKGPAAS